MRDEPTHLDLFSGIGGFALAAQCAGFRTVGFCENDSRCREFLERTWVLPVEPDIRTLDGRHYKGINLLTGGPPCQPASRAGEQRGDADDRWLWGEALRVLAEAEPDCVVFENPPGILDVGIDGMLSEMGRLGYETQCFDIPACAVDSPQLRHRIWIVGFMEHANERHWRQDEPIFSGRKATGIPSQINLANDSVECSQSGSKDKERGTVGRIVDERIGGAMADAGAPGLQERRLQSGISGQAGGRGHGKASDMGVQDDPAHTEPGRWERRATASGEAQIWKPQHAVYGLLPDWKNSVWVPCADGKLRRVPDDSFSLVDGLHRSLLGALGNSICPPVAVEILKAARAVLK